MKNKKIQTSYNYGNLFKLMGATTKLINALYFVKKIVKFFYFKDLETQTPLKHAFSCMCEDSISYFGEPAAA